MIEDYYKILKLTPNSGFFQINMSFIKQIHKYYSAHADNPNFEDLAKLTKAFEILSREEVKKYYDILYTEQLKNSLIEDDFIIQKYIWIVEEYETLGNQKAKNFLENPDYFKETSNILSSSNLWIKFLFYINLNLVNRLLLMPILCVVYVTIGIILVVKQLWTYDLGQLIIGIILISLMSLITFANFRQYIIDEVNK